MFLLTIILYKSRILLLDNNGKLKSVYSFVWAVIMVSSMDIAISQLLYNDDGFVENNTYLGANSLSVLDKVYVDIHHFIRSISFDIVLIYFLIMPFLIFGNKRILSYPLWHYLWQTDYVVILIVLTVVLISDFSLPHYVSKIVNNNDSNEIKFYVIHVGCIKLQHDIKKMRKHQSCIKSKCVKSKFIKFIKVLINNSYSSKRSNYVPTLKTFKLLYYMSMILFDDKHDLHYKFFNNMNKSIDKYIHNNKCIHEYIHKLIHPFMRIVLKYFKHVERCPISHRHKYTVKHIQIYKFRIIKNHVLFIDNLLCCHLIIKDSDDIDLLPYKLINKNFINCNKTWIKFNKSFYKSKFVQGTFSNNSHSLKRISYNKYPSNIKFQFIWNNIKKLFDKEMDYLHCEYRHGKGDAAKSLKNEFPIFFDEYINDPKFKYRPSKHEYSYKFLEKINNRA